MPEHDVAAYAVAAGDLEPVDGGAEREHLEAQAGSGTEAQTADGATVEGPATGVVHGHRPATVSQTTW